MNQLVLGTHNSGKRKEYQDFFAQLKIRIHTPASLKLDCTPAEPATNFTQNAIIKAKQWSQAANMPALSDDSGLCIDALDGAPGVHSKRFYSGTEKQKHAFILKKLQHLTQKARTAHFVCVIAIAQPNQDNPLVTKGVCHGHISTYRAQPGPVGFDYDLIFIPNGYTKTFAELPPQIKQTKSHRALALQALHNKLSTA